MTKHNDCDNNCAEYIVWLRELHATFDDELKSYIVPLYLCNKCYDECKDLVVEQSTILPKADAYFCNHCMRAFKHVHVVALRTA